MENNIEIWKDVKNYEGIYEISSFGNIRSVDRITISSKKQIKYKSKILSQRLGKQGYFYVVLCKNGNPKTFNIHQLSAMAFLNHVPCRYKLVVNHINFIKTDNRVENLEVITNRQNSLKLNIKSSSIYTGVSFCKLKKLWKSQIYINGKTINLGYFNCETKAHLSYYQQWVAQGLFEVITRTIGSGIETFTSKTTKITGKGQVYFADKIKN